MKEERDEEKRERGNGKKIDSFTIIVTCTMKFTKKGEKRGKGRKKVRK